MLEGLTLFTVFLYVMGLFLLMVEALIPGFGVAGIGGVICVIMSIIMISSSLYEALLILVITVVVIALVIMILFKLGFGKKYIKHFVLKAEQKNDDGYVSTENNKELLGMQGTAVTILRPAGTIRIGEKLIDAVSEGGFIDINSPLEVINVEGRRVIVRAISK